jgi:hypothetical protein
MRVRTGRTRTCDPSRLGILRSVQQRNEPYSNASVRMRRTPADGSEGVRSVLHQDGVDPRPLVPQDTQLVGLIGVIVTELLEALRIWGISAEASVEDGTVWGVGGECASGRGDLARSWLWTPRIRGARSRDRPPEPLPSVEPRSSGGAAVRSWPNLRHQCGRYSRTLRTCCRNHWPASLFRPSCLGTGLAFSCRNACRPASLLDLDHAGPRCAPPSPLDVPCALHPQHTPRRCSRQASGNPRALAGCLDHDLPRWVGLLELHQGPAFGRA